MKIITFLDVTPCRLVNSCFISGFRHGVKDLRCSGMLRSARQIPDYFKLCNISQDRRSGKQLPTKQRLGLLDKGNTVLRNDGICLPAKTSQHTTRLHLHHHRRENLKSGKYGTWLWSGLMWLGIRISGARAPISALNQDVTLLEAKTNPEHVRHHIITINGERTNFERRQF